MIPTTPSPDLLGWTIMRQNLTVSLLLLGGGYPTQISFQSQYTGTLGSLTEDTIKIIHNASNDIFNSVHLTTLAHSVRLPLTYGEGMPVCGCIIGSQLS